LYGAKAKKKNSAVERSTTRRVKLTPSIQIEKVPIIVRAFFALLGTGRSRQMEGNVEENKARDKWCSLCVSCGERPRLINRRIDTRLHREKTKDSRLFLSKKTCNYKSYYNDARPVSLSIYDDFFCYYFHYFSFLFLSYAIFKNCIKLVTINN